MLKKSNLALMSFSLMEDARNQFIDADTVVRIAKENGLSVMDIMDTEFRVFGEEALRAALKKYDVKCGCLIFAMPLYEESPEELQKAARKALQFAKSLGTEMLMVVPGGYDEKERAVLKGMTRQQKMDKAVEGYRLVVEAAQEYGIPIGFENTPHDLKPLASMQDCEYLLEHVPGLEFVFDTANSRVADTCCNELEIYERLKKYIGRIHLKDVVIGEFASGEQCTDGKKIRCVPSGSGVIPIKELLHRMQEDGYEGMLTVEYASPAEIHGSEHIEMARVYVDYITECLEGEPFQTQYGNIDGIEKPVSRMFFGTAIEPMLVVERKAKNVLLVPEFVQKEETEKTQQLIENMQTGLRHAVEYGKEKQIDVSIEDFDALMAPYCRIAVIADFLEKVPGLKFSFDTGNFVMYHENELEAFELFRDKICTVHLKDRCRESEKTLSVWKETAGKEFVYRLCKR